jgi:hypothetical protein
VAVLRIAVRRILEQEIGNTRRPRIGSYVYNDSHHHPLYARWLGSICRRVSRHGRERCLSHEGCRSLGCIRVSAAAGCCESVTVGQRIFSRSRRAATARLIEACFESRSAIVEQKSPPQIECAANEMVVKRPISSVDEKCRNALPRSEAQNAIASLRLHGPALSWATVALV